MQFSQTPIFLKHLVGLMVGNLALVYENVTADEKKNPPVFILIRELELSKEIERSEKA